MCVCAALWLTVCGPDKAVTAEGKPGEEKGASIVAEVPKDHEIFVNLVDFCRLILPKSQAELFPRWACTLPQTHIHTQYTHTHTYTQNTHIHTLHTVPLAYAFRADRPVLSRSDRAG